MFEKYQKKMNNLYIFLDLLKMKKKIPEDFSGVIRVQNRRIRRLMKKAYQIPFYRERFDAAGVKPEDIRCADDLSKLPLLYKEDLRVWMREEAKDPKYEYWYHDTTSGSSGEPLMILLSPKEKAYMMANWFRVMMVAGYNPFFGRTMSRKSAHSVSAGRDTFMQRLGILRRGFLDQYAPEEEMVRQVNEYKPDYLYMNKTELMRLCLYCKDHQCRIHQPRYYSPTGEMTDAAAYELFTSILGPGIVNSFGTAECGAQMVKLFDSDEYVIHHDSFVVNIYDEEGNPAEEGSLVVTPLYQTDLPIINYAVGDKARAVTRNGVKFITEVQGRMNDYFKYEDGRRTTFFEIAPIIAHSEDVLQIRFIQEDWHRIHIQIVQNKDIPTSREEIEERLTRELNAKFKEPFRISYEWMDVIPPDKNGKLRMIVCRV